MAGKMIVSPMIIIIIFVIVAVGYFIVNHIADRKWGYTKKREEELEKEPDFYKKK